METEIATFAAQIKLDYIRKVVIIRRRLDNTKKTLISQGRHSIRRNRIMPFRKIRKCLSVLNYKYYLVNNKQGPYTIKPSRETYQGGTKTVRHYLQVKVVCEGDVRD